MVFAHMGVLKIQRQELVGKLRQPKIVQRATNRWLPTGQVLRTGARHQ